MRVSSSVRFGVIGNHKGELARFKAIDFSTEHIDLTLKGGDSLFLSGDGFVFGCNDISQGIVYGWLMLRHGRISQEQPTFSIEKVVEIEHTWVCLADFRE
jgi:hypothetical protein